MRADKTAAEMDKQLNKCHASKPLRTKAIVVLRLLMRARGSRSIPRDQKATRSGDENGRVPDGGKKNYSLPWINLLCCFPAPTLVKTPLKKCFCPLWPFLNRKSDFKPKNQGTAKFDSNAPGKRARVSTLEEGGSEKCSLICLIRNLGALKKWLVHWI